eukprot:14586718-Alexandrium_andersonii.AAC.1
MAAHARSWQVLPWGTTGTISGERTSTASMALLPWRHTRRSMQQRQGHVAGCPVMATLFWGCRTCYST